MSSFVLCQLIVLIIQNQFFKVSAKLTKEASCRLWTVALQGEQLLWLFEAARHFLQAKRQNSSQKLFKKLHRIKLYYTHIDQHHHFINVFMVLASSKNDFSISLSINPQKLELFPQQTTNLPKIQLPARPKCAKVLLWKVTLIANKRQLHLQQMANKSKKSSISLLAVALLAVLLIPTSQVFSALEVDTMLTTIDNLFFVANPQARMEIRKFLRAAFHDCMGGCDGSINLMNSANRGLQKFANMLYNTHRQLQNPRSPTYSIFSRLSRADFWVLCEQRALAWGMKNAGYAPSLSGAVFSYGRTTTDPYNTDNYEGTLPDGIDGWQKMLGDIAAGIPVLSEADIVTLFGLHGAGTATFNNSGFSGPWGPATDKNVVNNNFFINLLSYGFPGANFAQRKAADVPARPNGPGPNLEGDYQSAAPATDKIQWQRTAGESGARMMLPIDMQIYLSFTPNATGGQTAGQYCPQGNNSTVYPCINLNNRDRSYLPLANTAGLAMSYAQNSNLFYINLISAFNKMVGYTNQNTFLTPFAPGWFCVNGVARCLGDVYFSGCDQSSRITC